jgi:hypothetical protein
MIQNINQKNCERRRFTISELSSEFLQSLRTVLYEIVTVGLGYGKFYAKWLPKILTGAHKIETMAPSLNFFERYRKDGD